MSKIRDFFANLKKSTKITLISCVSFVLMTFIILCFFIISPITPDDKAGNTFGRESVSSDGSTVSDLTTSGDGNSLEVSKGTTNTTAPGITTTHVDYTITVTSGTGMYYDGRIIIGGEYGENNYNNNYDNNSNNNDNSGNGYGSDDNSGNGYSGGDNNSGNSGSDDNSGNGYSGGDNNSGNSGSDNNSGNSGGGDQSTPSVTEAQNSGETGNNNSGGGAPAETPQQQTQAPEANVPPQVNPDDLPSAQTPQENQNETPNEQPAGGGESAGENAGGGESAE
ncbi:MAG: hypothetical protein K5884_06645 [Ruminococcus sp.]|nr:hypothetical protein [Ruminococcus sp.]